MKYLNPKHFGGNTLSNDYNKTTLQLSSLSGDGIYSGEPKCIILNGLAISFHRDPRKITHHKSVSLPSSVPLTGPCHLYFIQLNSV